MPGSIQEFIKRLVDLTNKDEIKWELPILNIYAANYRGWKFYTELLQDEQPRLEIRDPNGKKQSVQFYGLGIEELNNFILCQHKRLRVYEYSPEHLKKLEEEKVRRKEEDVKKTSVFDQFLKRLNDQNQEERKNGA